MRIQSWIPAGAFAALTCLGTVAVAADFGLASGPTLNGSTLPSTS